MTLEVMKTRAELMRVQAAKCELEYRIASLEDEINRVRDHILKQSETELVLKAKLNELGDR